MKGKRDISRRKDCKSITFYNFDDLKRLNEDLTSISNADNEDSSRLHYSFKKKDHSFRNTKHNFSKNKRFFDIINKSRKENKITPKVDDTTVISDSNSTYLNSSMPKKNKYIKLKIKPVEAITIFNKQDRRRKSRTEKKVKNSKRLSQKPNFQTLQKLLQGVPLETMN